MPQLDFWYDFASTYSYPAAMRIEAAAQAVKVDVRWRPFLLGPIFAAQGLSDSPFNLYPVKGRYMWRDLARIAQREGIPWRQPTPFPQRSLLAARAALAIAAAHRPAFTRAVYTAQFADGQDIARPETIRSVLARCGLDADAVLSRAESPPIKDELRDATAEAQRVGVFGAPTFVTGSGELFWGNDRLEQALAWAAAEGA